MSDKAFHKCEELNILIAALSIYFNRPYNLPKFTKTTDLDSYAGVYKSPTLPIKITISKDGSSLVAQATGQGAFLLDATNTPDRFVFEQAGVVIDFKPASNQFTLKQGGGEFVFTKEN